MRRVAGRWITRMSVLAGTGLAVVLALTVPAVADVSESIQFAQGPIEPANFVHVKKGERRMYLYRDGRLLKSYKVSLGLSPRGHKEREGDYRTPEGRYLLSRRNPESEFFLSVQVSYPNERDVAEARRNGWSPGGSIMVHGLPNVPRHSRDRYVSQDWTNGCIALSNEDMLEFWLLTQQDIPIQIDP